MSDETVNQETQDDGGLQSKPMNILKVRDDHRPISHAYPVASHSHPAYPA